ncbi:putative tetratricopeptide-like helical domain superfamily [Helianthus annuus]|nr:putative tetratricopeptide-like helical domain superfamily [Helianthus annuus]
MYLYAIIPIADSLLVFKPIVLLLEHVFTFHVISLDLAFSFQPNTDKVLCVDTTLQCAGLYWKIIDLFCDGRKFQEAANFLDEMVFEGIPIKRVTWSLHVKIHNTVVRGLCSANDANRAFLLYRGMRNKGINVDGGTFEALVALFCGKRDLYKAGIVLDEMVIDGCMPGEDTWSVLVCRVWGNRKVQEAIDLMSELVSGNQI